MSPSSAPEGAKTAEGKNGSGTATVGKEFTSSMLRAAHRGQTEPLAALAAVFAVSVGITLFVGAYGGATSHQTDRNLAEPTLERTVDRIGDGGTVDPRWITIAEERISESGSPADGTQPLGNPPGVDNSSTEVQSEEGVPEWFRSLSPNGYHHNITILAGNRRWSAGPRPANDATTASRRITVERAPGEVESGRLIVEVWS